ncbi:MAG: AAA family ATPase [Granulosicoccus sp.]
MLPTEAKLYLPISEETVLSLLVEGSDRENTLKALSMIDIACLLLLARLPAISEQQQMPAERLLADIMASCKEHVEQSDLPELCHYAAKKLDIATVNNGFNKLTQLRIAFLDDELIKQKMFLSAHGLWNFGFQQQHRDALASQRVRTSFDGMQQTLSAEQSRMYREFEAQNDEHMHIQGYAGTGKSSLIKSLLSLLDASGAQILVLAAYKKQLDALCINARTLPNVDTYTFTALAEMLIPLDLTSSANRTMRGNSNIRATMPDDVIVRQLGIKASGGYSTNQIVKTTRAVLYNFCLSSDSNITQKHIPIGYANTFDDTLRAVICEYARDLWHTLLSPPTKDFRPQIRGFHKIKWAALNDWKIPEKYTHVLVDECHDLPKPVLQILARSPQARATLGDDYQNLQGQTFRPAHTIRLREMVHSVRSGKEIESIINPIIAAHPSNVKTQFEGNSVNRLKIDYYRKAVVPTMPALILVRDNWGLFEWVQRLASKNITPTLFDDQKNLDMFVQDCIELKNGGSRARHGALFRFTSWDELATAHRGSSGFHRFNQLLEKGYKQENWRKTYRRLGTSGSGSHVISLIENVRNREFDNVMLAPDIFHSAHTTSKAAFSAAVYIAVTRARRNLMAPVELRHWIEEISRTRAVERKIIRRR